MRLFTDNNIILSGLTAFALFLTPALHAQDGLPLRIRGPIGSVAFGAAVASGHDVDHDGRDEIFIIDPLVQNPGGETVGTLYMYSGKTRRLLWSVLGDTANGMDIFSNAKFIGDVNGDHRDDILIGHPGHPGNGQGGWGAIEIRSGIDGTLLFQQIGGPGTGGLGRDVCALGDINNDGVSDFAAIINTGKLYYGGGEVGIFSGKTGQQIRSSASDNPRRIRPIADLDYDRKPDLLIGQWFSGDFHMRVSVYSSRNGYFIRDIVPLNSGLSGYAFTSTEDIYDGNFLPSVITRSQDGDMIAIRSGVDGSVQVTIDPFVDNRNKSVGFIDTADVTGDGNKEIIVGLYTVDSDNSIAVIDMKTLQVIRLMQHLKTPDFFNGNQIALGRINDDAARDIIIAGGGADNQFVEIQAGAAITAGLEGLDRQSGLFSFRHTIFRDQQSGDSYFLAAQGVTPGSIITFFASTRGIGCGYLQNLGICLDIRNPNIIARGLANEFGTASILISVPANAPLGPVLFQAMEVINNGDYAVTSHVFDVVVQ